jgi:hypothetical protein
VALRRTDARGRTLYLHGRWVTHAGGTRQLLVYFAAALHPESALTALPEGYELVVSRANGRPYARRAPTGAVRAA